MCSPAMALTCYSFLCLVLCRSFSHNFSLSRNLLNNAIQQSLHLYSLMVVFFKSLYSSLLILNGVFEGMEESVHNPQPEALSITVS